MYDTGNSDNSFAMVGGTSAMGSQLVQVLMSEAIVPGSDVGYQTAKVLYEYHPLGAILAEAPIKRAQGQARIIAVPVLGEERIVKQFETVWKTIGKVGATKIIRNLSTLARVYGIASIGVGERGKDSSTPLDYENLDATRLFFNVFDPLNTAGSLVLNQDPNDPDFLKQGTISVQGKPWHPSRTIAKLNEEPIYISFTASAFGFVGRSVYQRALYPMKTFVRTMVTDEMVARKAGMLVYKGQTPGSFIDQLAQSFAGVKRQQIKSGVTDQVLQIGVEEDLESVNLEHLEPAARFARENCIKNVASAAGMPASIIAQETLTEGFGEGSEDAKKEASYLNDVREEMEPVYAFMDRLVMRIAWTPEFYAALKRDYPELRPYATWLHECMGAFSASWPNVLIEPESEKAKTAKVQMESVVAFLETLGPQLDPVNKAKLFDWACDNANERTELFASKLDLDIDELEKHLTTTEERMAEAQALGAAEKEPSEPATMSGRS